MKNGLDSFKLLTDVLFEPTDGPVPSFPQKTHATPETEKAAESPDIVERRPSWQPAR